MRLCFRVRLLCYREAFSSSVPVIMTNLNRAVVLITGATGGFGRHMTHQFMAAGSRVILTDLDAGGLATLKSEFDTSDNPVLACIAADLSTADGCQALFDAVETTDLQPDILINNAGIAVSGRIDNVPRDRWEALMQINLLAPMRLCDLFVPQMIKRGSGHIVNISSVAGWIGAPGMASYCAAKFGLRGYSECLSADVAEFSIKVSAVYPYFSRTPILDSERFGYEERMAIPDEMVTDPADVVAAIIKGVKRNRLHIFPDKMARRIHYMKRYIPWLIPLMSRRMQQRMIQSDSLQQDLND